MEPLGQDGNVPSACALSTVVRLQLAHNTINERQPAAAGIGSDNFCVRRRALELAAIICECGGGGANGGHPQWHA